MYKLFKSLVVLTFVGLLLGLGSFAGANLTAGRFLGPTRPLTGPDTRFAFNGVDALNGKRFVWILEYRNSKLPNVRRATFYVSPTGDMLAVIPRDLDRHIEAWEKTQMP